MPTVAIYSSDVTLRRRLDRLLRTDQPFRVAGSAGDAAAFGLLLEQHAVDVAVADAPHDVLSDWCRRFDKTAFVAMTVEADAEELDALAAGAYAVLDRSAGDVEIVAAIIAAQHGLALLPRPLLGALLAAGAIEAPEPRSNQTDDPSPLTPRELEVLVAMADGMSNKTIARRLGISYHTVKFHVAGILAKLDADSRTEAVARAAHLGLVML
jgi:two-component system, NarL family, response regulator YdfI